MWWIQDHIQPASAVAAFFPGQGSKQSARLRRVLIQAKAKSNCLVDSLLSPAGCRTVTQVCGDLGIRQADQRATVGMPVFKLFWDCGPNPGRTPEAFIPHRVRPTLEAVIYKINAQFNSKSIITRALFGQGVSASKRTKTHACLCTTRLRFSANFVNPF
jgi:hypothetical protein